VSDKPDPHPALDATVSAPGVTPRRSGELARAAAATPGERGLTPATVRNPDDAGGATLQPGDTLGRYVIGERMGAGGMGYVYRARDPDLGREVAIKVLRAGGDGTGGALERRLLREAQAMATLSHDHLVNVYDIGVGDGRVFVAMELVDGGTLRALIADRARSWRDKLAAVLAAGRGLAAAHSAGVIHRDFKPDNVLIARSGRVKVVDFGLARAEREVASADAVEAATGVRPDALPADLSANLTQTGALLGTPAYMAPEQHAGEVVDARADQFAFAVTAWEAVYGQRPFPSDAYSSLVAAVRAKEITPPPRGGGVPAALEAVLRSALSPLPRDRYTSMDALLAAIDGAIRPRRTGRWLALAAAVVVAGGVATGYALTRDREPTTALPTTTPTTTTMVTPPPVPVPTVRRPARARRTTVTVNAFDLSDLARLAMQGKDKAHTEALMMDRMVQSSTLRHHTPETIACYDAAHVTREGTVELELELAADGRVLASRVLDSSLHEVDRCLLEASRSWRFPATGDGKPTTVRFPFAFTPADPRAGGGDERTRPGAAIDDGDNDDDGDDGGDGGGDADDRVDGERVRGDDHRRLDLELDDLDYDVDYDDGDGDTGDGGDLGQLRIQLPPLPFLPDGLDLPLPRVRRQPPSVAPAPAGPPAPPVPPPAPGAPAAPPRP
jgi:TonB family protein